MGDNTEMEFIDGLIVKAPRGGAPDFVKVNLSIKRTELIAWLQGREGDWINVQVKESRGGKWYAAVDPWKPKEGGNTGEPSPQADRQPAQRPLDDVPFDDDIPF